MRLPFEKTGGQRRAPTGGGDMREVVRRGDKRRSLRAEGIADWVKG